MIREAGHTIVELSIVGSILIVFAVTLLSFTSQQHVANRQHQAYTEDLLAARIAMDKIVTDLRHATAVDPSPQGVTIRTDHGEIRYTLKEGRLERHLGTSHHRRIADGIAELGCWQHGSIAHVRLVLQNRIRVAGQKHPPAIETSVALLLAKKAKKSG